MKHEYAEILCAIMVDKNVKLQRTFANSDRWENIDANYALCLISDGLGNCIRIATNTVRIGDMDVPIPMKVAPPYGTDYWVVNLFCLNLNHLNYWHNDPTDLFYLKRGICHLKEADCRTHAEALIKLNGGTL